jgi:hypothetical protein
VTTESSRKLLFTTIFLVILLSSSAYASLIPIAFAAEASVQEKGLSILSNVVSLSLTKYAVTTKEYKQDIQPSYLGVVPQKDVDYYLVSNSSKVEMLFTFANSRLQMIHVLENEGSPHMSKPTSNTLEFAKNFLSNYQAYTGDILYGELKSTLDNVDQNKKFTKTTGNTQLEVLANNGYTTFKWTYTFNNVKAPSKFIALGFDNSFLTYFVDNWQLYKIGGTSVNLSENEAKAIALETAKAHNWSLKLDADAFETKNFNKSNVCWTALVFGGSLKANETRSADPLMLYPVWRVGVALNKWYGNMYGIEVDIWADTKEIRSVQEAWSTMPPPQGIPTANITTTGGTTSQASVAAEAMPNSIMWVALSIIAATITGTASVWASRKRKTCTYNLPKLRSLKTGGTLFCFLILSMILLEPITIVSAMQPGGAYTWGSESTGSIDPETGQSWRKSANEIGLQRSTAVEITSDFAANGWDAFNNQGNFGSFAAQILTNIAALDYYYVYGAVVHFDHGVGRDDYTYPHEFHFMSEDNYGTLCGPHPSPDPGYHEHPENAVYDMDIYNRTSSGKIAFAFINTCLSANITCQNPPNPGIGQGIIPETGRAEGMPFAWTHRTVMDKHIQGFDPAIHISDDGYGDPDSGDQCYIGFPWGSASLEQTIPKDSWNFYVDWVKRFFHDALYYDVSVKTALNTTSELYFGFPFESSPLRTGFQAYWWNGTDGWWPHNDSTMAVYGNGNIHLHRLPDWNDDFDDNSMNTINWEKLEANGATANETTGQLAVTVPGGSGWAQAGYVTKYPYNINCSAATIKVPEFDNLDEMILQIGTTKNTSSDPFFESNWYRITQSQIRLKNLRAK